MRPWFGQAWLAQAPPHQSKVAVLVGARLWHQVRTTLESPKYSRNICTRNGVLRTTSMYAAQTLASGLILLRLAKASKVPEPMPTTTATAVILSVSQAPFKKAGQ